MRCPNCDNEVPQGKQFCGHCGHPLALAEPAPPAGFDEEAPTRVVPTEPEEPPAEAEAEATPAVEEPPPEKEASEPQPPAIVDRSWFFAWLSTVGWALGFALLAPMDSQIRIATYQSGAELDQIARAAIVWSIAGIVGGLLTGAGLHRAEPGVKRWHVFLITLGWAASLVLSWPMGPSGRFQPAGLVVGGSIGGFLTGLVWRRAVPSVRGKHVLTVTAGWFVGLLLGVLTALANVATMWQTPRPGIDYTLIGVISGAFGSGVMAWQLRRANHGE
jgi:hypothetical protein